VLHIGLTSCTFPPWTEMPKKNYYDYDYENQEKSKNIQPGPEKQQSYIYKKRVYNV